MSSKRKRHMKILTFSLAPAILIVMMVIPALSLGWDPSAPPVLSDCTGCHDESTLITGKATAWDESTHGTGDAYLRGASASCAGCHSGGGFSSMIAAGKAPNQVTTGDTNPTRQTCRACHQIHETGSGADWSLESTSAVSLYMIPGAIYDGGEGNLCVNCHQPRRDKPTATNGVVTGINSHWGPHHGPQSSMMLGIGANEAGSPSGHYSAVTDTCVTCHMGSSDNHSWTPNVNTCKGCHTGATNFDINGVQTTVQSKLDTLKGQLVSEGFLACEVDEEGVEECHPAVSSAAEGAANALWNWIYVSTEDGSKGVHKSDYTNALLDSGIATMQSCEAAPVLGLSTSAVYWASYDDYQARLLSVDYAMLNSGGGNAINVSLTNSSATMGVMLDGSLPMTVGNIAAGGSAPIAVKYSVPAGVTTFRVTHGATAQDDCGTTYTYGTQPSAP